MKSLCPPCMSDKMESKEKLYNREGQDLLVSLSSSTDQSDISPFLNCFTHDPCDGVAYL